MKKTKQDIITVKSCDNIVDNALLRVRIFYGWIIVSHEVRLNTANTHHIIIYMHKYHKDIHYKLHENVYAYFCFSFKVMKLSKERQTKELARTRMYHY